MSLFINITFYITYLALYLIAFFYSIIIECNFYFYIYLHFDSIPILCKSTFVCVFLFQSSRWSHQWWRQRLWGWRRHCAWRSLWRHQWWCSVRCSAPAVSALWSRPVAAALCCAADASLRYSESCLMGAPHRTHQTPLNNNCREQHTGNLSNAISSR